MNTKGIKFLAVLAVMVMAFAAIVALAPADKDVTAIEVYGNEKVIVDPKVIYGDEETDSHVAITEFYISDDATVKIRGLNPDGATFYVQNGKELELNFKFETTPSTMPTVTIYSVTADQQRVTTSTVDLGVTGGQDGKVEGKIIINETKVSFASKDNLSVIYNAMMPLVVNTHTTSGDKIVTEVSTGYNEWMQQYATISADDVLVDATICSFVTVAPGQYIQTSGLVDVNYGIMTDINDEITYYAVGMNAGSETIADSDKVIIMNGTIVVSTDANESNIKASSAYSGALGVTLTYANGNAIEVTGSLDYGSLAVSGKVIFTDFYNYSTVTLNSSAKVVSDSVMNVYGTLILKNEAEDISTTLTVAGTGKIVAQNEKLWSYKPGETTPYLQFKGDSQDTFAGQFDVYAITKVAEVREAFSTAVIERNQTFRVVDDTVVTTSLAVYGVLIIEPGVTVTITKTNGIGAAVELWGQYGQIINNGEILIKTTTGKVEDTTVAPKAVGLHINGGYFENNGKLVASSDSSVTADEFTLQVLFDDATTEPGIIPSGMGFVNNGVISVSKNDNVSLDENFANGYLGSVTINGSLTGDSLVNGGVFTLNNAKITADDLSVTMKSGAVFTIAAAEVVPGASITVKNGYDSNSIKIDAPTAETSGKYMVRGFTVTDTSTLVEDKLDLSGNVSIGIPTDASSAKAKITTLGQIEVSTTATINTGFEIVFGATELYVPGELTLAEKVVTAASSADKLTVIVPGKVTVTKSDLTGCTYIAAKYTVGTNNIYTNLIDAVSGASAKQVDIVEIMSDVENKIPLFISDDLVVPAGMTIMGVGKSVLVVADKATIAVESTARLSIDTIFILDGMITAEDVNDIDMERIIADVMEEDEESTAAACMSLEVALMLATPGSVINLANTFFAQDLDLVIPEGVTVNATAVEKTEFILVNSNLTVNGNLVVDQFKFIATTDDTIEITVNGYIYDKCAGGSCFTGWWYTPFGVSYNYTDEDDTTWFVLTSIDNLQPAIFEADDAKVTVEGDANLGDLTITGRDDMPAEVTFNGDLNAGTITIEDTTLKFVKGNEITATIADAIGSITIIGAYAGDKLSIYSMDDAGVYMAGTVTDDKSGTYLIRFDGVTGMDGTTKAVIDWGNYKEAGQIVAAPTIMFAGETLATGKKVIINSNDENSNGMATVTGTLVANNGTKLIVNSDMQVLGGLYAMERTEEAVAGSIEMNGDLFVGVLKDDIYSYEDAEAAYLYHEGAIAENNGYGQYMDPVVPNAASAATISGKIDLVRTTEPAKPFFITVLAGSNVDPAIVEDLASVDVIIEDAEWITVYGYGDSKYSLDGLKAPIVNADVDTILDANGKEVADFSFIYKVIYNSKEQKLSEYGYVAISLDYYVFNVTIKTDGSVKAVYIDGILMYTGENRNTFTLDKVATGTHKVTVEAATGYDADKCVLYTEMGTILPGMAFTFTEYDCEFDAELGGYVVIYNINGTEIQPEPVPPTPEEESQWTVTTILLVILVVLIAIMAVIVALRLNRS